MSFNKSCRCICFLALAAVSLLNNKVHSQPDCPELVIPWTWEGGSASASVPGVYSGENAYPGSREEFAYWTDKQGRFWLFGGEGVGESSTKT